MSGLYSNRKEMRKRQKPKLPEAGGVFHKSELMRLLAMLVAAILIGAVTIQTILERGRKGTDAAGADAAAVAPETDSVVVLPDFDVERLETLVSDATAEERVILDVKALDWAFATTSLLRGPHYEALRVQTLDVEAVDALLSDPPAYRANAFRARGRLENVRFYEAMGKRAAHFRAGLRLENGGDIWIAVLDVPDSGFADGDFVRVDGLFVELFRDEVDSEWVERPLIVGRRALESQPALPPVRALPTDSLELVLDDSPDSITGQPYQPFWELVAYVDQLDDAADSVDWAAAPLVTMEVINAIQQDGAPWRGKAVRFPPSEVLDCWTFDPGENPARLDQMSEGWLGNWIWKGPALVARFQSPAGFGADIGRRDVATARGFFLKNLAYDSKGGVEFAPFFVLHSAEKVPPAEKSAVLRNVTILVSASLLGLGALVAMLLVRDRRRSRELQADLIRRRRARREQRERPAPEGS